MKMQGKVGAVSKKGNSVMIGTAWYSQRLPFEPMLSKGDNVSFDYEMNGEWNNIVSPIDVQFAPKDVTQNYSQAPVLASLSGLDKDTLIVRQSCLKAAVELVSEKVKQEVDRNELAKAILITAEEFEKWVFR